jgi:hypothetical protein
MASKAQRAAVRSRADKANAAIGSFCKVKTIMPFVGNWIEAPPAPEEVSISSVFDSAPLMEMSQAEIDRMKSHDRMWANLESGHTADGLNEYDLRETTQDVLDSLPENDECGDPDDFCRKCGQFWGWQELNDNGHCLHCANKLRADPADEPDDDYVMDSEEAAAWAAIRRDNAERIYAEADAEDRAALAHINTPEYLAQMAEIDDADVHWALKEAVQRIADNFNDEQAALIDTVSDERMDEIENGTNTTPFKAYEYAALIRRQARQKDYDENSLNLGNAFAGE